MSEDQFELTHSNGIHIPHLSASTINFFIEDKTKFYDAKVRRGPWLPGPWMARGTAVEHAINEWLKGGDDVAPEMTRIALEKYEDELESWKKIKHSNDDVVKERDIRAAIPDLVECAKQHFDGILNDPFEPAEMQTRMDLHIDGIQRKFVGYTDYLIPNKEVRDCKVVNRTPSKLKQSYIIQGSLYRKNYGLPVTFDFIIDNKKKVSKSIELTDEEYDFGLRYAIRAAQIIEELEACNDIQRVMELMTFPNLETVWDDGERAELAHQWGIK